ncbi:universal stress protein UspA [Pandoraea horticolens]|uniref:Universal stress protein UspA n=1 Tax=Pandoraea horticolens TaxID=2508298 RepID=A0A5E4WG54_9BURK|nr:universal stress protein [Pandoraea horticolens]VVE22554.1 universal stress protein UspA [Pandoraea horticolens]
MLRKILVAVDGSHASRLATLHAIELAQLSHAEIKAIYIVDDSDALLGKAWRWAS